MEETLNKTILIKAENVCMCFKKYDNKFTTLKEHVINVFNKKKHKAKNIEVLKNISFEVEKGKSLGIIGHNGAGKSTLLKIVAGIYKPTSGSVSVNGNAILLNLGAGFDMEATAEENVYLNGAILGFTRKEIKQRFKNIFEFAELENFVNMPLKNFSSGMISRLAFSIAIDINPEILLIDETLSVGDANFQKKCMEKITQLKENGTSFLFVSHNINQVKNLCETTLWIENSCVMDYGKSEDVCKKYLDYCNNLSKN